MAIAEAMRDLTKDIAACYDLRVAGIEEIKKEVKGLQGEAQELVKGFSLSHEDLAAKLREELSKCKGNLKTDVREVLNDFQTAHKRASAELREELSEDERSRKSEVKGILRDTQKVVKDSSVARKQASSQLRKELGEHHQEIRNETSEILSNACEIRNETKTDLKEAYAAWQGFAATMQQKSAGAKVAPKVEEAKVDVPEQEAIAKADPAEMTPEPAELQHRVFEYLADHPDGTRMIELEREFDTSRIQMARVIRRLIDDGKVEKRDLLYFAI